MDISEILTLSDRISKDVSTEDMLRLQTLLKNAKPIFFQKIQNALLGLFYPIINNQSKKSSNLSEDDKKIVVDTLKIIFQKTHLDQLGCFFNIFSFLLFEVYDHKNHKVINIHEEYKLSIMECTSALMNSCTSSLTISLMTKDNSKKLCRMLYVALHLAITEKMRKLRIASIKCLLAMYKDNCFDDAVMRSYVANSFSFFLPGLAENLKQISLCEEKYGHLIAMEAVIAWGRIVSLNMEDYDNNYLSPLERAKMSLSKLINRDSDNIKKTDDNKEVNKLEEYLDSKRNIEWFIKSDKYLAKNLQDLKKLTQHSHYDVRLALAATCYLLLKNCLRTLHISLRYIAEILIILSEDEYDKIRNESKTALKLLHSELSFDEYQHLTECFSEGFYLTVEKLPYIFNGIDEKEQKASLNLLVGYVNLLSHVNIEQLLISSGFLHKLILTLLHVCEFEYDVSSMDENKIYDFDSEIQYEKKPWKKFKLIKSEDVLASFETFIQSFSKVGTFYLFADYLISQYLENNQKKEITYLLNILIQGLQNTEFDSQLVWSILNMYIEPTNWNLPLYITEDEYGEKPTLNTVRNNIIQSCLHVEGIGIISKTLKKEEQFSILLRALFLILSRAGSKHPLIHIAGINTLQTLVLAYGYSSITNLIEANMDYFAFYIVQNLRRNEENNVFQVLSVVLKYGSLQTLNSLMDIIEEVLVQSCNKYNQEKVYHYLQTFHLFLQNLRLWLNVKSPEYTFKTKAEKMEEEIQNIQINGLESDYNLNDFSNDIMGKSAEELWKEDMEKTKEEIDKEIYGEEHKKPEPPTHIKMVVSILKCSLNFLPSKEKEKKLLVLKILKDGLEIITEWEDELLPIVHLIWSPLVDRFKELEESVIINYSFQLLSCMGRISKSFIRNRTSKDVLPSLLQIMDKTAKESFLKDKGSAYRYSQSFKLQTILLENLIYLVTDIEFDDKDIEKVMDSVYLYLNKNQPLSLQYSAVQFCKLIIQYDPQFIKIIEKWKSNEEENYKKNLYHIT